MFLRQLRFDRLRSVLLWRGPGVDEYVFRELPVALAWPRWQDSELDASSGNDEGPSDTTANPGDQFEADELDF
jgi:hypothetical protein